MHAIPWGSLQYLETGSTDASVFVCMVGSSSLIGLVPLCVLSGGPVYLPHHHVLAGQEHPVSL